MDIPVVTPHLYAMKFGHEWKGSRKQVLGSSSKYPPSGCRMFGLSLAGSIEQWKKYTPGCLGLGDEKLPQLYGDYFINRHTYDKDPY